MDYQVLIVSRLDFGIRSALEHAGGIAPGNITEVESVDDAVNALDDLAKKGNDVGAIIYNFDIVKDRSAQFLTLMRNVRARQQPPPVIVMSIYNSKVPVQTSGGEVRQPVMSVAGAFLREGAFAHLPIDASPEMLSGFVKNALEDYKMRIGQSGSQ